MSKRKNTPEVIERANRVRKNTMQENGEVFAMPRLKCLAVHRDQIRSAGLEAMKKEKKKLQK